MAAYIERGELRLIYQHRIVLGPESQNAAEAVECAGEQGMFWAFRAKLFESQRGVGKGAFSRNRLKTLAGEIGLDANALGSCLDSARHAGKVRRQDQEAAAIGVSGTPSFVLNGKLIKGTPPVSRLIQMVEEELKKK